MGFKVFFIVNIEIYFFFFKKFLVLLLIMLFIIINMRSFLVLDFYFDFDLFRRVV